jgi:hypothetical protein
MIIVEQSLNTYRSKKSGRRFLVLVIYLSLRLEH